VQTRGQNQADWKQLRFAVHSKYIKLYLEDSSLFQLLFFIHFLLKSYTAVILHGSQSEEAD